MSITNKTLTYCFVNKHKLRSQRKPIFIIIACDDRNKSKYNCDSIDVRDSIEHTADGHSSMHYALNSKPSRGESVSNLNDETNC